LHIYDYTGIIQADSQWPRQANISSLNKDDVVRLLVSLKFHIEFIKTSPYSTGNPTVSGRIRHRIQCPAPDPDLCQNLLDPEYYR
jgi:hypothetical protein